MKILDAIKLIRKAISPFKGFSADTYGLYHNLRYAFRKFGNRELTEESQKKIKLAISDLPRYFGAN